MNDKNELIVYQGPAMWGIPNGSPFCIKLEFFLKSHKIPYTTKNFNPQLAPRGKMPFVKWHGELLGDSEMIIMKLCADLKINLDTHLSDEQRHLSHIIKRMLEEGTYFAALWNRWISNENWKVVKKSYFSSLPPIVKHLLPEFLRKQVKRTCYGHGISRYQVDEISAGVDKDLAAIDYFFSRQGPYFFGETISSLDYTVYSWLASFLIPKLPDPIKTSFDKHELFIKYIENINREFFPELKV